MQTADEQCLARAILDMELKMKHEMRHNSALQLAKMEKHHQQMEKHCQQMEKRLVIVEAKLEALLNRDNNSGVAQNSRNRSNNRQQYVTGRVNRPPTSYYQQTANLVNAQSDKSTSRVTTPVPRVQPPSHGMLGIGSNPQQRQTSANKQQRPKQMVGTGTNKTQGEKPPQKTKNETWTSKLGGVYTSDENSGEENGSQSHTDSELGYSVAKPAPCGGELR